jgi:hypothetical protein
VRDPDSADILKGRIEMKRYRYVLAASDGTSYDFARQDLFLAQCFDLAELLNQGWIPVRETPIGAGTWMVNDEPANFPLVMILLEKEFPAG